MFQQMDPIYQAGVRTKNISAQACLEIWCHVAGKETFFSRSLHTPLSGMTDRTTVETPFLLRKNEKTDYLELKLVFNGTGTVWIDGSSLLQSAL